jgi:hypothetical protein
LCDIVRLLIKAEKVYIFLRLQKVKRIKKIYSLSSKSGADEWNRTITGLRPQASETCASTSSATSAREKAKIRIQSAAANGKLLSQHRARLQFY